MGMLQPAKAFVPPMASMSAAPMKSGIGVTGPGSIAMTYDRPLWSAARNPQQFMKQAQELYRTNLWVGAAEDTVSSLFATVPWHLEDEDGTKIDDEYPREEYRQVRDLFEKPLGDVRELQKTLGFKPASPATRRELWKLTGRHSGVCGISYWYLDETDLAAGTPARLFYINPIRITPALDKAGNLTGYILDHDGRDGSGTPLELDEVLSFVLEPADFGHLGIGHVQRVIVKAQLADLSDRHAGDVLATGGRLAGMVAPKEGYLSDDQYAELVRNFRAISDMPDAAKRTAILRGPIEFTENSANPQELDLLGLGKQSRDDILAEWRVPLSQLGGPTAAGMNSGERPKYDEAVLWQKGVGPRLDMLFETVQYGLLDRWKKLGIHITLVLDPPEFDDDAPRYEIADKATNQPITVDERRDILGKDPLDPKKYGKLGEAIWLPAVLVEAASTEEPEPEPEPEPAPLPPEPFESEDAQVDPAAEEIVDGLGTPLPVVPAVGKARTSGLSSIRRSVDMRYTPAVRKAVQRVLEEQRDEIAAKVTANAGKTDWRPKDTSSWWSQSKWDKRLLEALRPHAAAIGGAVSDQVEQALASHRPAGKAIAPAVLTKLLANVGARVVGINQTTRDGVASVIGANIGLGGAELGRLIRESSAFSADRAEVIARTESATVLNGAAAASYGQYGVTHVEIIDGDEDEGCAAANGSTWTLEEFEANPIEHPNCTRDAAPVIS